LGESTVSNADDNQPDPNELDLPDIENQFDALDLPSTDAPDSLGDFGDLGGGDPLADLGQPPGEVVDAFSGEEVGDVLAEMPEESAGEVQPEAPKSRKKPRREPGEGIGTPGLAVFGFCGLSVLALLALDAMVFLDWGFLFMLLMNVFWLIATAIPFIMWMGRKRLNLFEVMLGLSLACIIIAVAILLVEMVGYGGEVKPKGVAAAVHSGSDRTMAVA
jgi:hypothetical protein